ncbi:hypothetical protein [Gimesia sp.]|uniref:hypothetical protein n=1 Tax=Gimesia sp. TaxID=2024833 RepID=UPI000C4B3E6A|nr:hypothetical protein [Gimesia sp.]MAX38421.1 hypothetical protein [Gimesia sp.]HAH46636.1 hypothetical protein [Planctomycetaceae bacterium]HBL42624.1 hypothetical protein [Planctomycetaceae bacterium]|tara:strand:- start:3500 stop:3784 length:285 start_codon:yes stop_codon:yes gene_type:complete
MDKTSQRSGTWRACEELHAIENRMVAIRKLLKSIQHQSSTGGEAMDDALKIAQTIEDLASYGRNSSAVNALEIVSILEISLSILDAEIDSFLTS